LNKQKKKKPQQNNNYMPDNGNHGRLSVLAMAALAFGALRTVAKRLYESINFSRDFLVDPAFCRNAVLFLHES